MSLHGELCVCTTGLYGGGTVVVGCTIAVARRQKRRGPAVDVVVYDATRARACVRCTPPARQTAVRAAVVSQLIGTTAARAVCVPAAAAVSRDHGEYGSEGRDDERVSPRLARSPTRPDHEDDDRLGCRLPAERAW